MASSVNRFTFGERIPLGYLAEIRHLAKPSDTRHLIYSSGWGFRACS